MVTVSWRGEGRILLTVNTFVLHKMILMCVLTYCYIYIVLFFERRMQTMAVLLNALCITYTEYLNKSC